MTQISKIALVAAALTLGGAVVASATPLVPGTGPVAPTAFGSITGSVVANIPTTAFSNATIGGTYRTEVVADTARGGLLDFLIQVSASAASQVLERITTGSFAGFTVDAGFLAIGATAPGGYTSAAGNVPPSTVDESINATVGFNFNTPNVIPAGGTSAVLVIETNARAFTSGLIGIIDSSTATVNGFAPAVPEPATMAIFGTALAGLGLLRRRRKNVA